MIITSGGGPDNSLPGMPPGIWGGAPPFVDNTLPPPPPGIWPPPVGIWPPVQLPPGYPMPPGSIWPPVLDNTLPSQPGRPNQDLPGSQPHPDQGLPSQPGRPGQGLPSQKFLVAIVAASAAGGLKVIGYTVVDPSLDVGMPLPGHPSHPIAPGGGSGNRPANPIDPGGQPGHPTEPGGQPTPQQQTKR
jgi:hypothetical protein